MEVRSLDRFYLPSEGGIFLDRRLINSPAFLGLSGLAIKIYFMLWMEARNVNSEPRKSHKKKYYVLNNGEMQLPYAQIEKQLGLKRGSGGKRIAAAFRELLDRGLIDVTIFGGGRCRVPNQYAFSHRWELFGKPGFKPPAKNSNKHLRERALSTSRDSRGRFLKA